MAAGRNELRMIWLITLLIAGISAWYLGYQIVTYLCGLGFIFSVMQYVSAVEAPLNQLVTQQQMSLEHNSKVPLYISSITAIVGGLAELDWLMGVGITAWVFFLLRWLQRLERRLIQLQSQSHSADPSPSTPATWSDAAPLTSQQALNSQSTPNLIDQVQRWIFQGNPVLKVAIGILVIGIILLLRFATEHWQISLAMKLGLIALASMSVAGLGYWLIEKNRSFALALEGLGLGALFLTLFFAYYNLVIPTLPLAALLFVIILAVTLYLSLKQESIELALMALLIAYLAPFTLPTRDASAVELISYYLLINIGVAVLSSFRPWKVLNQIAFLVTTIVGGVYSLIHGYTYERYAMTALILAHSALFIWLGFRFSQLLARQDLSGFQLKPVLDLALIFAAPITAYIFLYLIYFNQPDQKLWQAGLSLLFAAVFAICWILLRRKQAIQIISQSYLSLMLIFLALVPPILLTEQWSVVGWAVEGVLIYLWALEKNIRVAHYLSMGLLLMAGFSSLYYLVEINPTPRMIFWILSLCYVAVVVISQLKQQYQQQLDSLSVSFLSSLSVAASLMLFALLEDEFSSQHAYVLSLFVITLGYVLLNEIILRKNQEWSWLLPKWSGISPLMVIAVILTLDRSQNAVIVWNSDLERGIFALTAMLLAILWLRPLAGLQLSKEWMSLGVFSSLALASLCLIPHMPYLSMVILPLLFCLWCYRQAPQSGWQQLWQTKSCLLLMATWLVCSQLFSQQAFQYYWLPIFNPFDLISIAMFASFIWMLLQQIKVGRDKGMMAVLMVLSLLWLSSYIVLRALHVYLQTPFNDLELWSNATVQLSLTILWVLLAWITMWTATLKNLKPMWILGGSILVIVTLKLVLFDLSHIGTLTRVISFLLAGGVMLLIAYIAPMPEKEH
ncbi:DUF2339 domain-containing protein [Acinetobacter sp. BY419]|uniref:DUF2339 domain-containing protein n=1 Tax=Acinetobacter sp. BY419 TaxID=2820675 RepID=UPI001C249D93|nr:DUF2339 domain-containing protein [Acinetobacter sp. BY419]